MRITIVLPESNMSGGIRVAGIYAERLCQRGHKVVVVYPNRRQPTLASKVRSWLAGKGWQRLSPPGPSYLDQGAFEQRVLSRWRSVIDSDLPDADVVIATWWETAEWVAELSPRKGTKVILIQGYELNGSATDGRLKATWTLPMHKIVVSSWLADIAREEFGDGCVSLVPNAVDLKQFNAPPRGKHSFPTVGLVYSGGGIKGCDVSLSAYAQAVQTLPDLRLVVFGHRLPLASLSLPEGASFALRPPPDHLKTLYASCDAWLFGSRREGFGLPILEAMACRTPVIATPAGAAPDLLKSGGGLLVRSDDPADMSRAILQICRLPDPEWRAMSARAYAIASSYTWEDATDRFLAALDLATERARRGELG
jgi:glycosyltransferase involved in cell wall biosynthesis